MTLGFVPTLDSWFRYETRIIRSRIATSRLPLTDIKSAILRLQQITAIILPRHTALAILIVRARTMWERASHRSIYLDALLFPWNVIVTHNCCVNLTHTPLRALHIVPIVFYDRSRRPRIRPIRNYGIALVYHRLARFV